MNIGAIEIHVARVQSEDISASRDEAKSKLASMKKKKDATRAKIRKQQKRATKLQIEAKTGTGGIFGFFKGLFGGRTKGDAEKDLKRNQAKLRKAQAQLQGSESKFQRQLDALQSTQKHSDEKLKAADQMLNDRMSMQRSAIG